MLFVWGTFAFWINLFPSHFSFLPATLVKSVWSSSSSLKQSSLSSSFSTWNVPDRTLLVKVDVSFWTWCLKHSQSDVFSWQVTSWALVWALLNRELRSWEQDCCCCCCSTDCKANFDTLFLFLTLMLGKQQNDKMCAISVHSLPEPASFDQKKCSNILFKSQSHYFVFKSCLLYNLFARWRHITLKRACSISVSQRDLFPKWFFVFHLYLSFLLSFNSLPSNNLAMFFVTEKFQEATNLEFVGVSKMCSSNSSKSLQIGKSYHFISCFGDLFFTLRTQPSISLG